MTTKYYYSYNTEENIFSGKFPAIKNPRRQSEFLLPAMATFKEPPNTKENEVAIWNSEDWQIESDFRGEFQVDIETKEVSTIDYIGSIKKGFQIIEEKIAEDIRNNPEKYKRIKNALVDISDTKEYAELLRSREVANRKIEIERELLELDSKRVRAMCEPSVRDEETGETWLDYYNKQVALLRKEYNSL